MARLKSLPNRLAPAPRRLGTPPANEAERSRLRDETQPWRAWYKTARWHRLRKQIIKRDGDQCRQTGALLVGRRNAPNSAVVDHIRPHRGDPKLFWDPNNLQTVAKHWHDSVKQKQEKAWW